MSNAKQILAMVRSRAKNDDERLFSIALQVAASEARRGHKTTAEDIRAAVDEARDQTGGGATVAVSFSKPRGDLSSILAMQEPRIALMDVVLSEKLSTKLNLFVREQHKRSWLREHGKTPHRRVLLVGPPGSGKTMTAEGLAHSLRLPLFVIRLDSLITRFMGETASKLRLVFDEVNTRRGVYFFDEFDAVGSRRDSTNDVAEMRRVLNSFLQFMEETNTTDSVVLAATNHPELLDKALLRRFDMALAFTAPSEEQIRKLITASIRPMRHPRLAWKELIASAQGLSQAEIVQASEDAVKTAILDERDQLATVDILQRMEERAEMRDALYKD